jgi:SAM-dependent methyltransferase
MLQWREVRATVAYCPLCDARRLLIRLRNDEMAVRCIACRASAVSLSIVSVLRKLVSNLHAMDAYELSSRGPLHRYLKTRARTLTSSEYFHDVAGGEFRDAIQCQDVQRLTYADASFDLCTSTEVFEHVPRDDQAFSEIFRVLRPAGLLVFTVPLRGEGQTLERATLLPDGQIEHLLAPEYHGDPRNSGRVLAFRTYGLDITERLRKSGFIEASIVLPPDTIPWGLGRPVVVARKSAAQKVNVAFDTLDTPPDETFAGANRSR